MRRTLSQSTSSSQFRKVVSMADTTSSTTTPAQEQYPNLNPYQEKASSLLSSKVCKHYGYAAKHDSYDIPAAMAMAMEQASREAGSCGQQDIVTALSICLRGLPALSLLSFSHLLPYHLSCIHHSSTVNTLTAPPLTPSTCSHSHSLQHHPQRKLPQCLASPLTQSSQTPLRRFSRRWRT